MWTILPITCINISSKTELLPSQYNQMQEIMSRKMENALKNLVYGIYWYQYVDLDVSGDPT